MRTISYIISGNPKNRSDCIDYASKHKIVEIKVSMKLRTSAIDQYCYDELYAVYVWEFSDTTVAYEEAHGIVYSHEPEPRRQKSVELANERLKNTLKRIKDRTKINKISGENSDFFGNIHMPKSI